MVIVRRRFRWVLLVVAATALMIKYTVLSDDARGATGYTEQFHASIGLAQLRDVRDI
jgi:hypothetical protein